MSSTTYEYKVKCTCNGPTCTCDDPSPIEENEAVNASGVAAAAPAAANPAAAAAPAAANAPASLPDGWEPRTDKSGVRFYKDTVRIASQYPLPTLPAGWVEYTTDTAISTHPIGTPYYHDIINNKTQFELPTTRAILDAAAAEPATEQYREEAGVVVLRAVVPRHVVVPAAQFVTVANHPDRHGSSKSMVRVGW